MPYDSGAFRTAHRPVAAGFRGSRALGRRAGQDVMPVRRVAAAIDAGALVVGRGLLGNGVAVAVDRRSVVGDLFTLRIGPWTGADAVLGVHRVGRQIGTPVLVGGHAGGRSEALAIGVGGFEPA